MKLGSASSVADLLSFFGAAEAGSCGGDVASVRFLPLPIPSPQCACARARERKREAANGEAGEMRRMVEGEKKRHKKFGKTKNFKRE